MKQNKRNDAMNAKWGEDDRSTSWNTPAVASTAAVTTTTAPSATTLDDSQYTNYRAIYSFSARNSDELSFEPGDIIQVPFDQNAEPGWIAGRCHGHTGWFPETYVERCEEEAPIPVVSPLAVVVSPISETRIPEEEEPEPEVGEHYVACYPYESAEVGDLTFNAGESVLVIKKDGDWWTGKIGLRVGIFPSNYVAQPEVLAAAAAEVVAPVVESVISPTVASVYQDESSKTLQDLDSEVSEINTKPAVVDNVPASASATPVS